MTAATVRAPGGGDVGKRAIGHWTERAACRAPTIDPELFFPVSDSGPALLQVTAAKRICTACPVLTDCLAWALLAGEPAGIWGGTTPRERQVLRAQARRLPPDGADPWASLVTPGGTG
jgi:WhiB family transcriptional regulator, redox-sensing transcriptional regulator